MIIEFEAFGFWNMTQLTITCLECAHDRTESRDWYFQYLDEEVPTPADLGQLIGRFVCSKCKSREVRISSGEEIYFDHSRNKACIGCHLPIPLPRFKIEPSALTCVRCASEGKSEFDRGVIFPEVPAGMRGKCPACKTKNRSGIVVVYQNQKDKNFFLGCSEFPRCFWSSDKFYNELS